MKPDLYALVIKLTAANTATINGTQGHLCHAAFYNIMKTVDPATAAILHDSTSRKPFTISQLQGFGRHQRGKLPIRTGQTGHIRVTLLDPTLFQTFIAYFLDGTKRPTIRLNAAEFVISEILNTPTSHKRAGYTSLDHLRDHWQQTTLTPQHHAIDLRFASPTTYRMYDRPYRAYEVVPNPTYIFGNLARRWDQLTGEETAETTREYAAQNIIVTRHRTHTEMYKLRHAQQVGFMGHVQFELKDRADENSVRHINRLADLAFYTGSGSKTTHGMGQLRREQ